MKDYSRQPRKQRLAMYNRSYHGQNRAMAAHLSDELLKEYSLRSVVVRKGDTVKVIRGTFKGHEAKVAKVFPHRGFMSIEEATLTKADGKKVARMFRPSKVVITKLDLSDPWRREKLQKFKGPSKAPEKAGKPGRTRKRKARPAKVEEAAPEPSGEVKAEATVASTKDEEGATEKTLDVPEKEEGK